VVHAKWEAFTVAACAVVVVGPSGCLVAVAEILLPTKVRTSPAAETHAVAFVVGLAPSPPRVVTDCLGILNTAERGKAAAVAAARPLAAPWIRIAAACDGDTARLVADRLLVWMPSHTASSEYQHRLKSDGTCVTSTD
jgi:hypothetical protein